MGIKSRWVLVALAVAPIIVWNSCIGSNSAPSNTGFMWVATQGDQKVRSYTIRQTNGTIAATGSDGSPVATDVQPTAMIIAPDGKSMFIVNAGGTVTAYTVNSNGTHDKHGFAIGCNDHGCRLNVSG